MPARRVLEGLAERSPLEHPYHPPLSPFARPGAGYLSDASSDDEYRYRAPLLSLSRSKGSSLDDPSTPDHWHRKRGPRRRSSKVWLVTLPAFLVLVLVASVAPLHSPSASVSSHGSYGALAIRSLSHTFNRRPTPDPDDPVAVFLDMFEVRHSSLVLLYRSYDDPSSHQSACRRSNTHSMQQVDSVSVPLISFTC